MKKRLLNPALFFLSIFLLTSGMMFGQESVSIKEIRNKIPSEELSVNVASAKIKNDLKSSRSLNSLKLASPNKPVSILSTKSTTANDEIYFEDFESITSRDPSDIGYTVISGGKGNSISAGYISFETGVLPGYSGNYYLISNSDVSNPRNEWIMTPPVTLEAFKTYVFETFVYAPGNNGMVDEYKVCVGSAPTVAAMDLTSPVINKTGAKAESLGNWTRVYGTFSPAMSGTYYFGINVCTPFPAVGIVTFDDIKILSIDYADAPVADFSISPNNIEYGGVIEFDNKSTNSPYEGLWEFSNSDHTFHLLTSSNLSHTLFDVATGSFDVSLTASNYIGASPKVTQANALTIDEKAFQNYPYDLSETTFNGPITQASFQGWLPNYDQTNNITDMLTISNQLGDMNFMLSKWFYFEEKEVYTLTTQMFSFGNVDVDVWVAWLNDSGNGYEGVSLGTIYQLNDMTGGSIKEQEPITFTLNKSGNFRLAFRPTNKANWTEPESGQKLSIVGMRSLKLEGYNPNGIENTTSDDGINVSVNNGSITVTGAEGLPVSLVTIDGRKVYNTIATDDVTIPSVAQGIYIVKAGQKATKVMVK